MSTAKLLLVLCAVCVFVEGVRSDVVVKEEDCKDWFGDGGCDASCVFPGHRCCITEGPVCFDFCDYDYCIKDPEFCWTKVDKVCKFVPKKVCDFKTVCKKVKDRICKTEWEEKCDDHEDEHCDYIEKCDPPSCHWVDDCSGGGSVGRARATAFGDDFAAASASSSAFSGGATADADAVSDGFADASTFTSTGGGGCRRVQKCDGEKRCWKDRVCNKIKKPVCKKHPIEHCWWDWKDDCKKEPVCDFVDKEVCDFVEVEVCKDPVKCGTSFCDPWFQCNPQCCPIKKIPVCIVVKVPVIGVKPVHG